MSRYASSISSESSVSSSRSFSRSSTSSKRSRISEVSHTNIKSDGLAVRFLKYASGVNNPSKPLSLRRTRVEVMEGDYDYDDGTSFISDGSSYYYTYAWVTPRWGDSISEIASRSGGSGGYQHKRAGSTRRHSGSSRSSSQGSRPEPPVSAPFMPPPDDFVDGMGGEPGMEPDPGFYDLNAGPAPPPPPPGPNAGFFPAGGSPHPPPGSEPVFIDLNAQGGAGGGGGGGPGKPGKYDDWV